MKSGEDPKRLYQTATWFYRIWMFVGVYLAAAGGALCAVHYLRHLSVAGAPRVALVLIGTAILCTFNYVAAALVMRLVKVVCHLPGVFAPAVEVLPALPEPVPTEWEDTRLEEGFLGLGLSSTAPGLVESVSPFGAAAAAGLRRGDRILRVGSYDVRSLDSLQIADLVRGPSGTRVTVPIERTGIPESLAYSMVRRNKP